MKVINMAAALACGTLIVLFILAFTAKNPETALYQKTVKMLMQQEGLNSFQETTDSFPALKEIKSKMDQITHLNQFILSKTRNPAPVVTEEETLQMEYYLQQIHQLRKGVKQGLTQLIASYTNGQP